MPLFSQTAITIRLFSSILFARSASPQVFHKHIHSKLGCLYWDLVSCLLNMTTRVVTPLTMFKRSRLWWHILSIERTGSTPLAVVSTLGQFRPAHVASVVYYRAVIAARLIFSPEKSR